MTSLKGVVLNIQKFSIHDGPGIRTTIFMKGCSLKCKWCHNPESISHKIQLNFDKAKCILCKSCIEFTKGKGISISNNQLKIDFKLHDNNLDLIKICPNKAFSQYGSFLEIEEIVKEVIKDKDYYDESGGGVTFSGGEALNQMEFIRSLSNELKNLGINIFLDISGFDPLNKIKTTLDWVDGYLLDYKLTNNNYKELIGSSVHFDSIINFLNDNKKEIILRCPIIPTINDSKEHFQKIAFISNNFNVSRVDILPYHNLKKKKEFLFSNIIEEYPIPNDDDILYWKSILKQFSSKNTYMNNQIIN